MTIDMNHDRLIPRLILVPASDRAVHDVNHVMLRLRLRLTLRVGEDRDGSCMRSHIRYRAITIAVCNVERMDYCMVCAIKPGEETIEEWVPRPETSPIRPVRPSKQRRESNTNSKVLSIY